MTLRGVIEELADAPGSYWQGDEYWTLCPFRPDSSVGSFSIDENGRWYDFATGEGGGLVDLVMRVRGCDKQSALGWLKSRGVLPEAKGSSPPNFSKKRPRPVTPQDGALLSLNRWIKSSDTLKERYGKPVRGWTYKDETGRVLFAVVRFERDEEKSVIPFYYGEDGHWHQGLPYERRPLFNLHLLKNTPHLPVLVVEGEKCASVEAPGYVVTTWPGGAHAVHKADWSPLIGRSVVIWPDNDEPGWRAAQEIKQRLPGAKILTIPRDAYPEGWDIADAAEDGVDLVSFIEEHLPSSADNTADDEAAEVEPDADNLPFIPLGYDRTHHHFLIKDQHLVFSIPKGGWTRSRLLELAPLDWWAAQGLTTKRGSLRVEQAQDLLVRMSRQAGMYRPDRIRGAGVWRDGDDIVVNDGERLVLESGENKAYDDYGSQTGAVYTASPIKMGNFDGEESTIEEGFSLLQLFESQKWENPTQAVLAMGWSLIAPFAGLLRWRPHIWITGRRGTGKSWLLERVITPLCGDFAFVGSSKTTEAGLRRALDTDARPVILDEMEPLNKRNKARVDAIIQLARDASCDASAITTIAAGDGTVTYATRSMFAFASVQVPDYNAAIESRIIRLELSPVTVTDKRARSLELLKTCMRDPGRYRRRIARRLRRILSDMEYISEYILDGIGDNRLADQLAPLLAAAWAAISNESIDTEFGREWLKSVISIIADKQASEDEDDEIKLINHLLSSPIKTDLSTVTVAELIERASDPALGVEADSANLYLSRIGMRIITKEKSDGQGQFYVAVATHSDQIMQTLEHTAYAEGYDAVLKRHPSCVTPSKTEVIRFAIGQRRARLFDLRLLRQMHLGIRDGDGIPTPAA